MKNKFFFINIFAIVPFLLTQNISHSRKLKFPKHHKKVHKNIKKYKKKLLGNKKNTIRVKQKNKAQNNKKQKLIVLQNPENNTKPANVSNESQNKHSRHNNKNNHLKLTTDNINDIKKISTSIDTDMTEYKELLIKLQKMNDEKNKKKSVLMMLEKDISEKKMMHKEKESLKKIINDAKNDYDNIIKKELDLINNTEVLIKKNIHNLKQYNKKLSEFEEHDDVTKIRNTLDKYITFLNETRDLIKIQ